MVIVVTKLIVKNSCVSTHSLSAAQRIIKALTALTIGNDAMDDPIVQMVMTKSIVLNVHVHRKNSVVTMDDVYRKFGCGKCCHRSDRNCKNCNVSCF